MRNRSAVTVNPFPAGLEIYAVLDALEPVGDQVIDADLWAMLRWMVEGLGGHWSLKELGATGRLHQVSAALAENAW
jgi:hypothetical protein